MINVNTYKMNVVKVYERAQWKLFNVRLIINSDVCLNFIFIFFCIDKLIDKFSYANRRFLKQIK